VHRTDRESVDVVLNIGQAMPRPEKLDQGPPAASAQPPTRFAAGNRMRISGQERISRRERTILARVIRRSIVEQSEDPDIQAAIKASLRPPSLYSRLLSSFRELHDRIWIGGFGQ
jgi:hypothetical protein